MKADYKNIKAEYEAITRDLSGFDKKRAVFMNRSILFQDVLIKLQLK